jgi:hypothetical protein
LAERLHDGDLRDTLFKRAARYRADHGHRPKNPEETGP